MKIFKRIAAVGLFFFFAPLLCAAEGIQWETDFKTAMKLAQDSGRLVIIHFYGDSCMPCRKMDKDVFALKDVADALAPYFIPLKVNSDTNPKAVQNLKIDSVPMDLVVTPDREIIYRRKGYCTPFQFVNELVSVAVQRQHDMIQQQQDQELYARQAQQVPVVSQTALLDVPVSQDQKSQNNQNNILPPPSAPRIDTPQFEPQPAMSPVPALAAASPQPGNAVDPLDIPLPDFSTPISQEIPANPVVNSIAETNPVLDNVSYNSIAQDNIVPGNIAPEISPPVPDEIANVEIPQIAATTVPPANPALTLGAGTGVGNVAPQSQIAQNEPPLFPDEKNSEQTSPYVLDGFCPVELQDHERWTTGSSDYAIRYKHQYFLFSSEEAMRSFAKNPKIYMPVAMGDDIVQMLHSGQRVKGKRHYGAWYHGRIYLFATQANYDAFAERPGYFADFATRLETAVGSTGTNGTNRR